MSPRKRKKSTTAKAHPLVPPPNQKMSRKRARQVTTQFHKLTRHCAATTPGSDAHVQAQAALHASRPAYQQASQVSTAFHSTSKWVLGYLSRNGWYYGIVVDPPSPKREAVQEVLLKKESTSDQRVTSKDDNHHRRRKKKLRRPTRILEIGAINTELLDAAAVSLKETPRSESVATTTAHHANLHVRAIDLHCMDRRIEKADFLQIPVNHVQEMERYDVAVCSMVLNCVATATARGEMVCRLYHFLRPEGLLFLTIPRTCLALSPYMDKAQFARLLTAVGFCILETKESPKIAFYVCQRRVRGDEGLDVALWRQQSTIRRGKKYTNDFAIVLSQQSYEGKTLTYPEK